jgi:hypothetical protein
MSSLASWDVFYVYVEQFYKCKYVIVVAEVGSSVGVLFINTEQISNADLQVCDVAIDVLDHPFLHHRSYVSGAGLDTTGRLMYLPRGLFIDEKKGVIAPHCRATILQALNDCPSAKQKTLDFINQHMLP